MRPSRTSFQAPAAQGVRAVSVAVSWSPADSVCRGSKLYKQQVQRGARQDDNKLIPLLVGRFVPAKRWAASGGVINLVNPAAFGTYNPDSCGEALQALLRQGFL